ncbi:MAG: N-formylglutamate amidohydrolase [Halocynthiibacter sp.]
MTFHQPAAHHPFFIDGPERPGRWVVVCDHATNAVPANFGAPDLGLPAGEMARHIAYDVGAAGLSLMLAKRLDSPALLSNFSRLLIDPNRGEDDPTLLMKLYDGTIVPANRHAGNAERERRLDSFYRPYHTALADMIARHRDPVILSIHSFTPQLAGRDPRPWHIGLLYGEDARLALPLLDRLRRESDLCIGANEPYSGHLPGDTIDRHAIANGLANVLIEIRNDLIATEVQQRAWADRLAPILQDTLISTKL